MLKANEDWAINPPVSNKASDTTKEINHHRKKKADSSRKDEAIFWTKAVLSIVQACIGGVLTLSTFLPSFKIQFSLGVVCILRVSNARSG